MLKQIITILILGAPVFAQESIHTDAQDRTNALARAFSGDLIPNYDILNYGKECAEKLGELPDIDCLKGTEIPVTLNGKPVSETVYECDHPGYLRGKCHRFSRLLNLSKGDVQTVVLCRNIGGLWSGSSNKEHSFDDVAIIQTNKKTNETCFFQSIGNPLNGIPSPYRKGRDVKVDLKAKQFWEAPRTQSYAPTQCQRCHDSDLWIHTPWIDQIREKDAVPSGIGQGRIKLIGKPYENVPSPIRFKINLESYDKEFPPSAEEKKIAPADTCTKCHFIGQNTARSIVPTTHGDESADFFDLMKVTSAWGKRFPHAYWMPPTLTNQLRDRKDYLAYYKRALEALARCAGEIYPFLSKEKEALLCTQAEN